MAKKIAVTAVTATETGVRLSFERLGERFDCDVNRLGVPALTQLLRSAMAEHGAAAMETVEGMRFAETPDRAPALLLEVRGRVHRAGPELGAGRGPVVAGDGDASSRAQRRPSQLIQP